MPHTTFRIASAMASVLLVLGTLGGCTGEVGGGPEPAAQVAPGAGAFGTETGAPQDPPRAGDAAASNDAASRAPGASGADAAGAHDTGAPSSNADAGAHPPADAAPVDTGSASSPPDSGSADPGLDAGAPPTAIDSGTAPVADSAPAPVADSAPPPPPPADAAPPPTGGPGPGILVGYYATWSRTLMPPASIPWSRLTHVAHAFVLPATTGGLQNVSSYVDPELIAIAHAHGVKVVASVGGAGANFDANVDPAVRAITVRALADLCATHGYDGIDLDWEFPDATTGPAWGSLIAELRVALDAISPGLTISAATASGAWYGDHLPDAGLRALDWVGVMTYDYAGPWSATAGHESPLYPSTGGDGGSVSESVQYFVKTRGLPADHVLLGLPFYGAQLGPSALGGSPVAPATSPEYRDIVGIIGTAGWTASWDDGAKVPFLQRAASPGFLSYDDARSIGEKCAYGKSQALRGAIIWHLAADRLADGTNPLLEAAQPCR